MQSYLRYGVAIIPKNAVTDLMTTSIPKKKKQEHITTITRDHMINVPITYKKTYQEEPSSVIM